MNPETLRQEIAELTSKEQFCYKTLAQIRSRKEKLILFLYEQESINFNDLPSVEFSDRPGESSFSLKSISYSIGNPENHSRQLAENPLRLQEIADLIISQIAKMQLWSFGITYMAQVIDLEPDIVGQSLRLESYSRFWQLKKKTKTDTLETWITDLDLINSLPLNEDTKAFPKETAGHVAVCRQKKEDLVEGRKKAFKRSLPPNSTDDLVEKSSSVMDLLNRVFDSNRGKQLNAIGILDYLYPRQVNNWSKEEKRFRVQLVSRELCTSIKRGNWCRISVGVYSCV